MYRRGCFRELCRWQKYRLLNYFFHVPHQKWIIDHFQRQTPCRKIRLSVAVMGRSCLWCLQLINEERAESTSMDCESKSTFFLIPFPGISTFFFLLPCAPRWAQEKSNNINLPPVKNMFFPLVPTAECLNCAVFDTRRLFFPHKWKCTVINENLIFEHWSNIQHTQVWYGNLKSSMHTL